MSKRQVPYYAYPGGPQLSTVTVDGPDEIVAMYAQDTPPEPPAKPKKPRGPRRCCEYEKCFYCDMPLIPSHEHDHFPTPFRFGGKDTVPCCKNCHALKDTIPLDRWPMEVDGIFTVMMSVWYTLPPVGRIWLAKILALSYDALDIMHKEEEANHP